MWGYLASYNLHVTSGWNHRCLRCRPTHAHPVESFTSCWTSPEHQFFTHSVRYLRDTNCLSRFQPNPLSQLGGCGASWPVERWKIARRCGAKHISKRKCTKHLGLRALLEVEMSKKCTPLWREAHLQVKMHKTHQVGTTFGSWDVEKVYAVVARSTFPGFQLNKSIVKRFVLLMVCLNKVIVKQLFSPTLTFQESNDLTTAKSQTLGPRIYCAMAGNLGFTSWLMCLFSQCCWMKTMDLRSA